MVFQASMVARFPQFECNATVNFVNVWHFSRFRLLQSNIHRRKSAALACNGLQRIHKHGWHIKSGLVKNLLETCRTGDIDFGKAVANHIQAHQ